MATDTTAYIIGNGSIGKEIRTQVLAEGWRVGAVITPKDAEWRAKPNPSIVFLAIPSTLPRVARDYILHYASQGVPVVTCEKGALSEYFKDIHPVLDFVGYSAAVGGGTCFLSYIEKKVSKHTTHIFGSLNGTLNYIFSRLESGTHADTVCAEVLRLAIAEPGATSLEAIIASEFGDIQKKGIIIANCSGLTGKGAAFKFMGGVSVSVVKKALAHPEKLRFLFSMRKNATPSSMITGKKRTIGGWVLEVGLFDIAALGLSLPRSTGNMLVIRDGHYEYTVSGPGAGPEPTVHAMMADARELLP